MSIFDKPWFDRFRKRGKDKEPPKDEQKQPVVQKPHIESTRRVSWSDLELTSEVVDRTNQELTANYGRKVALNAMKLDTSITALQIELHSRGFDILMTSHFALQVILEESRRAYSNMPPEHPWAIAVVIEAERRVRIKKDYAGSYKPKSEEIDAEIGEMTEEAKGAKEGRRLDKLAESAPKEPRQPEDEKTVRMKLIGEAQYLARRDMARAHFKLGEKDKLPPGAMKQFMTVEVPPEAMKKYFQIAKKKYRAMHGLPNPGRPKNK